MRLLKEYYDFIHWRDWQVEEPIPNQKNLLAWAMVCFEVPGDKQSVRGYYYQVRLPVDADNDFKAAAKAFARRQLIKNFDLPLEYDHVIMRHIAGLTPYEPWLGRVLNSLKG